MGLFKKNERPVVTELKCPSEECSFTCNDDNSLKRHVEWKHPELSGEDKKIPGKIK